MMEEDVDLCGDELGPLHTNLAEHAPFRMWCQWPVVKRHKTHLLAAEYLYCHEQGWQDASNCYTAVVATVSWVKPSDYHLAVPHSQHQHVRPPFLEDMFSSVFGSDGISEGLPSPASSVRPRQCLC